MRKALLLIGLLALASYAGGSTLRLQAATVPTYVTRAEAVMILLTTIDAQVPTRRNDGQYPDVLEGAWYLPYMLEAIERGMLNPNSTHGLLYPYGPVTRAQFLKLLTIAHALPTGLEHTYTDVPAGVWFEPFAGMAQKYRVFESPGEPNLLRPDQLVTHEQAALALQRTQDLRLSTTQATVFERPTYAVQSSSYMTQGGLIPRAVLEAAARSSSSQTTTAAVRQSIQERLASSEEFTERVRRQVVVLTNDARKQAGLPPLRINLNLQAAAQNYAKELWQNDYFDHVAKDGRTYVDRIQAEHYFDNPGECGCSLECFCRPKFAVGENLAKGQLTPEQVVQEWMASEGHKRNILQPVFEEIGIGMFGDIWVQNFGKSYMLKEYVEVR